MLRVLIGFLRRLDQYVDLLQRIPRLEDELDALRSRHDISVELIDEFARARNSQEYQQAFVSREPLVSICIATYNRADLLVDRCLRSVINQDYTNLEIIVVGDCCTDHTAQRVSEIRDPRLTFVNLSERGRYPENPSLRWMVAGTAPINHALGIARGDFITHLDDDDKCASDRIRRLVMFAQSRRADLVWHPFWHESPSGRWILNTAERLAHGSVTTSSILYHRWFTRIAWDLDAFRYREPADFNRLRKLKYLGLAAYRYPEPLLWHFRERNQQST